MRHHAFAAAMGIVTAALLAPSSQSLAASADPTGYWMKPDAERESKILVFKCGTGKKLLCAKIAWLKEPNDTRGQPLHDVRNEDPSKRGRGIVGLAIFTGLAPSAPSTWTGQIYNPEDGHTYSATLTVLSRKQILLRGCKAWLLCGEKQWLRTAAPEELKPAAPAEGTEQIEASAEPATPPSEPEAKPAAVAAATASEATPAAPAPQAEVQAMAAPQAPAKPQEAAVVATPVSLVTQDVAAPVAAPAEVNAQRGYGFLNVSTSPDTAARLSGENVSSMFVMTKPIATEFGNVRIGPTTAPRLRFNPTRRLRPRRRSPSQSRSPRRLPSRRRRRRPRRSLPDRPRPHRTTPRKPTSMPPTHRQARRLRPTRPKRPKLPWSSPCR